MKRSPKKTMIPAPGYLPLSRLLEINRDAIRAMPKNEKNEACKAILKEILLWSTYTIEESIGALQIAQYHFLQSIEND
jgi:hypothetical protein